MPNHVTTRIRINASQEKIDEILESISTTLDNGNVHHFDFNKLVPRPEELNDTTSPTTIVSLEEREKQLKEREEFDKDPKGKHEIFRPRVDLTQELSDEYKAKFGADNWYDWSNHNWGTKWGAYNTSIENGDTIVFDTAWSHPDLMVKKLSEKFPDILFEVKYADEDTGVNCGYYSIDNGEEFDYTDMGDGSYEAVKFACEVKGYDHDEYLAEMAEYDEEL